MTRYSIEPHPSNHPTPTAPCFFAFIIHIGSSFPLLTCTLPSPSPELRCTLSQLRCTLGMHDFDRLGPRLSSPVSFASRSALAFPGVTPTVVSGFKNPDPRSCLVSPPGLVSTVCHEADNSDGRCRKPSAAVALGVRRTQVPCCCRGTIAILFFASSFVPLRRSSTSSALCVCVVLSSWVLAQFERAPFLSCPLSIPGPLLV